MEVTVTTEDLEACAAFPPEIVSQRDKNCKLLDIGGPKHKPKSGIGMFHNHSVIDGKLYGQDFHQLRDFCLKSGTLFNDLELILELDGSWCTAVTIRLRLTVSMLLLLVIVFKRSQRVCLHKPHK